MKVLIASGKAFLFFILIATACKMSVNMPSRGHHDPRVDKVDLPEGFHIELFADSVENARSLARGTNGTIFVSTRSKGNVYALRDINGDFIADEKYVLATGLHMPNGVAFKDGSLFVAEVDKIWRYDDIEDKLSNPPKPKLVTDDLPDESHHGWKYIAFGPDGKLYVPVGAPCNICLKDDKQFASILRMNPDGTGKEVYAHGVRNSVGFDWQPGTDILFFTDNGRDWMGDEVPPCEVNRAPQQDMHFGYPFCHGGDIADPKFGDQRPCSDFTKPFQNLGAHVAPLGMKFYRGNMFPEEYRNKIFIAEHGSWNRKDPLGYRITTVSVEDGKSTGYDIFAAGWLRGGEGAWGRPVDILELPDGSLLVSDDEADMIYRITYTAP